MKKDVLINIRGVYNYEQQEPDVIELFTTGTYQKVNDHYLISYDESSATGFEGSHTTLKVENNDMVTMCRTGEANTQLIVQNGVRHQCQYNAGYGDMMIGVNGHSIISTLDQNGGDLEFKYTIDVNTMLASENQMFISVKEQTKEHGTN